MPKYPCGICTIGVKYKGILCTGQCKNWYHTKCLDWNEKTLKTLTKTEIENWQCKQCLSELHRSPLKSNLEKVKEKVLNISSQEENNFENSLSLAAEVGNALLNENQELKQNIVDLTVNNSKLLLEIEEIKKSKEIHISYQYQIEELENEKESMLSRLSAQVEQIDLLENQLLKEKKLRIDLENIFDDTDKEKEETIIKLENTIRALQEKIRFLETTKPLNNIEEGKEKKTAKNMTTQTSKELNLSIRSYGSCSLDELVEIKTRQTSMEDSVRRIQEQLTNLAHYKNPSIITTEGKTQAAKLTSIKATKHNGKFQKLNANRQVNSPTRKNLFSVSLQNLKYRTVHLERENTTKASTQKPYNSHKIITQEIQAQKDKPNLKIPRRLNSNKLFKVTVAPPITAKKRKPQETIQSFFETNIEEAKASKTKALEKTMEHEINYFLEQSQTKESKP